MPSAGPNNPGTLVDDATIGGVTWSSPSNAGASDNTYATATLNATTTPQSHYLKATNFGFSIPGGSTIVGIAVEAEVNKQLSGTIIDGPIKLVIGGSIVGTDKARGAGSPWTGTDTYVPWGGSSDLWGTTPIVADVNASDFGAVVSALCTLNTEVVRVDHIRITVHYVTFAVSKRTVVRQAVRRAAVM